ncbi:MAG: DUF3568 family protein [Nitrospiraceae bacterium]|nr:MAG: DUF3568 family protein [Nitrospiraceae bacterium]
MKKTARALVLLLSLTFLGGCELALLGVGAGVGVGAYKYIEGSLERQYPLEYARAWDATNTALANLQISVSGSLSEGGQGDIEAVKKDGAKVNISLKDMGQKVTSISIRVGTLGNRDEAVRIHNEIAAIAGI